MLSHVWSGLGTNNVARFRYGWRDVDVDQLILINSGVLTVSRLRHGLWRIGRVGRWRGWQVVLEEHIELVRAPTNPAEDIAFHELIDIRTESVNDIMVIPNIHLSHVGKCLQ